jgi:hypothetical protein
MKKIVLLTILLLFFTSCSNWVNKDIASMNIDELITYSSENKNLTPEDIESIFDRFWTCEQDSDCESFYWKCPLACQQAVNKNYLNSVTTIMDNWYNNQTPQCVYSCVEIKWVTCQNNKCKAISADIQPEPEDDDLASMLPEGSFAYSWTLNISWVGPEISFEAGILDNTLALRYTNLEESYTDHLFIDAYFWQKFNNDDDLTLPWSKVYFDGMIYSLEWAAGNHYYQAALINKLEKVANPTQEKVQEIIDGFSYCETDNDCSSFYWECPLSCHQAVNTKYLDITQKVMNNWHNNQEPQCAYGCVAIKWVKCENYKCVAIPEEIER